MRKTGQAAVGIGLLCGAAGMAAEREPLIVTQLPDPDPNYVPAPEPKLTPVRSSDETDGNPTLDQAMQNLGRAIGQAVQLEQQAAVVRCKSGIPSQLSDQQRWAWEAHCAYRRH